MRREEAGGGDDDVGSILGKPDRTRRVGLVVGGTLQNLHALIDFFPRG